MRSVWLRKTGPSELREGIPDTDCPIAVLGYGGMSPDLLNGVTRRVAVSFQQLDDENASTFYEEVSFSHLRALRIGSVWQNRRYVGDVRYDDLGPTEVDFSPSQWRIISASTEAEEGRPPPLNGRYRVSTKDERKERSWLLEFRVSNGRTLLVPCMEFLLHCYGVSELIPRALTSMPWDEAVKLFLVNSTRETSAEGKWVIRPTERMRDGDRAFLGHVLHTADGQRAAKSVADQCETESKSRELIFPRVKPWFSGKVPVSARGLWVREGRTFLALRMDLLGEPTGPGIVAVKTKKDDVNRSEDHRSGEQVREGRQSFTLSPESKLKVHITTGTHSFGNPPERREPKEERFPIGPRRDITTVFERESGTVLVPDDSSEPGVQVTSPGAPDVPEALRMVMAHGTLVEMWRALQALKANHPQNLHEIQWLHAERGFVDDDPPELIALQPFAETDQVEQDVRNWVTRDIKTEPPRGVLVLQIQAAVPRTLEKKTIFVLEIERRRKQRLAGKRKVDEEADSYRGLSVVLAATTDFDKWLRDILARIRYVSGHVVELQSLQPDLIEPFKHSQSRTNNTTPFRASALLALKKAGVEL